MFYIFISKDRFDAIKNRVQEKKNLKKLDHGIFLKPKPGGVTHRLGIPDSGFRRIKVYKRRKLKVS